MLTSRRRARAGFTLAESMIALVLGGLVLGLVVGIETRLRRLFAAVAARVHAEEQIRDADAVLSVALRGAASAEGDIAAGEARDTSLVLRATFGGGIVCDTVAGAIVLPPASSLSRAALAWWRDAPAPGDTVWALGDGDEERWTAHRVRSVDERADRCRAGPFSDSTSMPGATPARMLGLDSAGGAVPAPGTPVRLTRPERYSVYRSGDGRWYLGLRDWNPDAGRLNAIQPVSGPYAPPARGVYGLQFRYLDASGVVLPSGASDTRPIALVQVVLRPDRDPRVRAADLKLTRGADSALAAVALRNHR